MYLISLSQPNGIVENLGMGQLSSFEQEQLGKVGILPRDESECTCLFSGTPRAAKEHQERRGICSEFLTFRLELLVVVDVESCQFC